MRIDPAERIKHRRPEPHAGEFFTDREPESVSFGQSLAMHRRLLNSEGVAKSPRNVLVYYGVGGVGKTTLSQRLQAWVDEALPLRNGWGVRPATRVDVTIRLDLHGSAGHFDVVAAVVAIRQRLGSLKRNWPAFDFAFAAYWAAAHPGEPIPGAGTKKDGGFSGAVMESVGTVITDLGGLGTPTALGLRSVRWAVEQIRIRSVRRLVFGSFDGYEELLERCAELPTPSEPRPDIVAELAVLLAHDLSSWPDGINPMVVVFVDAFERLTLDRRRIGEARLNQIIWSMPNVLFVITGRDELDWHDDHRTTLYCAGRETWPGLVPGVTNDPCQHLIRELSSDDSRQLILRFRERFELPIADDVVEELVAASGGLPEYLDLAREVAMTVKRNGGSAVSVEDVTGSLGELVSRVLEDVPDDEQRAIRAAALFACFDVELIAVTGGVDHGCAMRAVLRPMIDNTGGGRYPYRMHDEIRAAIRSADHRVQGGWSSGDWREAGTRAVREARRRHDEGVLRGDGPSTLAAIGLAVGIVCDQTVVIDPSEDGKYADWLTRAIVYGPSLAGLRPHLPAVATTEYGRVILSFVLAKSHELPPDNRWDLLQAIFDSDHPLAQPAGRHLAYGLRNQGRWDEALAVFDQLIRRHPSDLHRYQRALTLLTARRFRNAEASFGFLSEIGQASLRAHLALTHGQPKEWLDLRPSVLQRLKDQGKTREHLEERSIWLLRRVIIRGDVTREEVARLLLEAESVGHSIAIRDCLAALILLAPKAEETPSLTDRLMALDNSANDGALGYRTALVHILRALVADDRDSLRDAHRQINAQEKARSRQWVPIECLLDEQGYPLNPQPTQWLKPYSDVRDRWCALFKDYRSRVLHAGPEVPNTQG